VTQNKEQFFTFTLGMGIMADDPFVISSHSGDVGYCNSVQGEMKI